MDIDVEITQDDIDNGRALGMTGAEVLAAAVTRSLDSGPDEDEAV